MNKAQDAYETRIANEKRFHDERFADDSNRDEKVSRFYAIADSLFLDYENTLLKGCAGNNIVEYGCGTGSKAFKLAEHGASVVGIDISTIAIEEASETAKKSTASSRLQFKEMNAEILEFQDSSIDRICGSGILHHLDINRSMNEILRVLKPGGSAVFVEPLGHNPFINFYRLLTPKLRTDDEHPLTAHEIDDICKKFSSSNVKYYYCFSLAASLFHNTFLFFPALKLLGMVDNAIFSIKPLRRYAWCTLIELRR